MLVVFAMAILYMGFADSSQQVSEAQSNVTEHDVTPSTFATYFDIDSTTSVATLKSSYKTDVTLVFGAGTYTNPIKIEGASNVTLKASTRAATLTLPSQYSQLPQDSQASVIRTDTIIETTVSPNRGAIVWIEGSTNVTFEGFAMYFDSFVDGGSASRFYAIVVRNSSGTVISDNFIEKVCDPSPTADGTYVVGQCRTSGGGASLKWAIAVFPYTTFTPTTDANDKVTNLVPISVLRNEIKEPGIAGIQITGFYDFTVADNVVSGADQQWPSVYRWGTGIALQAGASGSVTGNTISNSHEGGINYAPQFTATGNLRFRIVSNATISNNTISESRTAGIQIGGNRCDDAKDGTEVDVVATITRNHIFDNYKGVNVTSCYGTDEEEVTVDITANTFEHINTTPHEYGIYGSSVYVETAWDNGATGVVGKFDVKIRHNVMKDSHRRVVYWVWSNATLAPGSVVDARYNYWGTDRTESPKDTYTAPNGTTQNRFGGNQSSKVLYGPWVSDATSVGKDAQNLPQLPSTDQATATTTAHPVVSSQSLSLAEGDVSSFTVKLDSDPGTTISYSITSTARTLSFEPDSVTFNSDNWNQPQSVTVVVTRDSDTSDETANISIESLVQGTYYAGPSGRLTTLIVDDKSPIARVLIGRIVASITSISVSPRDKIRLSVDVYGVQDILDNSLGDGLPIIFWDDGGAGGSFEGTGREVVYKSPSAPGTYTITVKPPSAVCQEDRLPAPTRGSKNCEAQFEIKVLRKTAPVVPTETPLNPDFVIPEIIVGANSEQCEVFTPEEGGRYQGEGYSIVAGPSVVPNGEIIGVCMSETGVADNSGMTAHRYSLGGSFYRVQVVDVEGAPITSYLLNNPVEVCLPVPSYFRSDISKLALVAENDDQSLTILSGRVRLNESGLDICGSLSTLPVSVAVGTAGAPDALPTPMPEEETDALPDTGGYVPPLGAAMAILILLLGLLVITMFGFTLTRRTKV